MKNWAGNIEFQDDKTLEYYNIKSNSKLTLKQKIPEKLVSPANTVIIKIIRTGETFRIQVNPTNTIENIKQKIHNVISVLPDRQRLVFEGKILEDSKTLQDYNVGNGYILNLVFKPEFDESTDKRKYIKYKNKYLSLKNKITI